MLVVEITHVVLLVQESLMVTIRFVVSGHQVLYSMLKAKATMNTRTTYISFDHSVPQTFYAMGVTLAAGYSLNWLKQTFLNMRALRISFNKQVPQQLVLITYYSHLI